MMPDSYDFIAAYLKLSKEALRVKIQRAEEILTSCTLCPRSCKVDRTAGEKGFCKTGSKPLVSSFNPHFGEERPLVGERGSGTIFFSRCNLGCLFCQNWTISHNGEGSIISFDALAGMMLSLQNSGCHNINLVTPTHQVPMILRSLEIAKDMGLKAPIVYNCGGYESIDTLKILDGVVDIYMPDIKYSDPDVALKYSKAKDYPQVAKAAVKEMHRQVGDLVMDERGIALRGLLVRHLVLPEGLAGTEEIVKFLAEEISPDTYTNIMAQYYPCYQAAGLPPLDRRTTGEEYIKAVKAAQRAGLKRLD
ncbi:radical SAM superfamily protein [bacterium BMS3Bbin08]|nr:radical SAM superfamily protein [bacterium BMS3Bbin08]